MGSLNTIKKEEKEMARDNNRYYVMVVPTSKVKDAFRPCVLDYDLDFEKAKAVQRDFIKKNGLYVRIKGQRFPARIHVFRTSETLPENYFIKNSILGVAV